MRNDGKVFAAAVLMVTLAVGIAGCSAKPVYRSSRQLCLAQGGSYSDATQQCSFAAATTVGAKQACDNLGGIYMPEYQRCELDD